MADGDSPTEPDVVDLVRTRYGLLETLVAGPVEPGTIRERLDVSRSTVNRALGRLRGRGLVERQEDGYGLTLTGRLLVEEYRSFVGSVEDVVAVADLLNGTVGDDQAADPPVAGLDVVRRDSPEGPDPDRKLRELHGRADRVLALCTAGATDAAGPALRSALDGGADLSVVFERAAFERLDADGMLPRVRESDVEAWTVADLPCSFSLVIHDDDAAVCLLGPGRNGALDGILVGTGGDARAWARELFERYRSRGENVWKGK